MSALSTVLGQAFIRRLLAFSGYSVLVYDYIITFPLEVDYIWNAPWSFIKTFFLINRYTNLIGLTYYTLEEAGLLFYASQRYCSVFWTFSGGLAFFSGESIRILVLLRAWAIWGCKRRIAVFLVGCYAIYIIAVVVVEGYMLKTAFSTPFEYLNELHLCFAPLPPRRWLILVGTMLIDALALAIVCGSFYHTFLGCRSIQQSSLVRLLLRDAMLFYITSLLGSIVSVICLTTFRQDPRNFIQISILFPSLSVVGQRLVLNLRGLQGRPDYSTYERTREEDQQIAAMVRILEQSQDSEIRIRVDDEMELRPLSEECAL